MPRVPSMSQPSDFAAADAPTREAADAMFAVLYPGVADPAFDAAHRGLAIAAHNPVLAQRLAQLSGLLVLDTFWAGRPNLREVAIQAVHLAGDCRYAFDARVPVGERAGLDAATQRALGDLATAALDDEQRLVARFADAVAREAMDDELFAAVAARFGERAAVELAAIAAFWTFWTRFLNATGAGD